MSLHPSVRLSVPLSVRTKQLSSHWTDFHEIWCVFLAKFFVKFKFDIWAFLGYYGAYGGNTLPTFRDNLSVPSSRVKISKKKAGNKHLVRSLLTQQRGRCWVFSTVVPASTVLAACGWRRRGVKCSGSVQLWGKTSQESEATAIFLKLY